ncbi:MAG: hypothetical protein U0S12_14225 [Fimbriimonadales bacterium]
MASTRIASADGDEERQRKQVTERVARPKHEVAAGDEQPLLGGNGGHHPVPVLAHQRGDRYESVPALFKFGYEDAQRLNRLLAVASRIAEKDDVSGIAAFRLVLHRLDDRLGDVFRGLRAGGPVRIAHREILSRGSTFSPTVV